ncbi:EF-hand domain-containing protein D2-like [Limulus polyphemus]|uniref:EF-hand domain-containing protein D2-like n=1 Tax=Limulus polyphemus TaxID=6850 RepID=A0ABM1SUI3_LIMPO|nr:EF-hand domain-containing protein D2-like [Limulus polyphemus]XP_022247289.1 EF-hand domain-containing protein D2-like [Limulus polyphemus]
MADAELAQKLARRQAFNEWVEGSPGPSPVMRHVFNPYTDFPEFSRKEIKEYEKTFKKYDVGADGFIDFQELKRMMEKLAAPQTHLALKEMIQEVDEDKDNKISFREFLLIFRKANAGDLTVDSGLDQLAKLTEIDVDQEGVGGAKSFFEAKIEEQKRGSKFEEEIRSEKKERIREEEERKQRKAAFLKKANFFGQAKA